MNLKNIRCQIAQSISIKQLLLGDDQLLDNLSRLIESSVSSLKQGGKIIFAGNGGSFADAQHLSAEFISRFMFDRAPLASLVLGANNSAISAIGNDYGYDQVFARELEGVSSSRDVFVPISTSGNSENIITAAKRAEELGLTVFGLTGMGGGKLKAICPCICVPSSETARIQECHILLGHIYCGLVEEKIFQQ